MRTLPAIARQYGVSHRQINYVVDRFRIEPTSRLGPIRLYDTVAEQVIVQSLKLTGATPGNQPERVGAASP